MGILTACKRLFATRKPQSVQISTLVAGSKLSVQTRKSSYEITIVDRSEILIVGGNLPDGQARFPDPVPAFYVGSSRGALNVDWLTEGAGFVIEFGGGTIIRTSPVAKISFLQS